MICEHYPEIYADVVRIWKAVFAIYMYTIHLQHKYSSKFKLSLSSPLWGPNINMQTRILNGVGIPGQKHHLLLYIAVILQHLQRSFNFLSGIFASRWRSTVVGIFDVGISIVEFLAVPRIVKDVK